MNGIGLALTLLAMLGGGVLAGLLAIGMMRPLRRSLHYRRWRRKLRQRELQLLLIEPYPLPQAPSSANAPGEAPSSP